MNLLASLLMISCLLHFNKKNDIKKGKYPNEIQILSFLQKQMNDLFDAKDT